MTIPILFESGREPTYQISYADGVYTTLWNPNLPTHTLSKMTIDSVRKQLKEPDETGRLQVLGIYQQLTEETNEERTKRIRNEEFIDWLVSLGGKTSPISGFDHVRRDLVLVAYSDANKQEFQDKVKRKLSRRDFKAREQFLDVAEEAVKTLSERQAGYGHKESQLLTLDEMMRYYIKATIF